VQGQPGRSGAAIEPAGQSHVARSRKGRKPLAPTCPGTGPGQVGPCSYVLGVNFPGKCAKFHKPQHSRRRRKTGVKTGL
jgi:hypothetical protein